MIGPDGRPIQRGTTVIPGAVDSSGRPIHGGGVTLIPAQVLRYHFFAIHFLFRKLENIVNLDQVVVKILELMVRQCMVEV